MTTIKTKDGTEIFYKDWGSGQPIVFHHGWPLSADDWDTQMLFFLSKGYRVIAHDRRGHGRSTQTSDGHEMDTYAADVNALVSTLGLKDAIHVGHSTGGGEATRYVARYGKQNKIAKLVLIGAVPPLLVKAPANPQGIPRRTSPKTSSRSTVPSSSCTGPTIRSSRSPAPRCCHPNSSSAARSKSMKASRTACAPRTRTSSTPTSSRSSGSNAGCPSMG
jgi:pimeloyl-ACP methyl ester carboxylesterase